MGKSTQGKINSLGKIKREFSAGGAVFTKKSGKTYWFLIKSFGKDTWQLPKGRLEDKETSAQAAIREVFEETGIETKIIEKIGTNQYFYFLNREKIFKTVTFFLMEKIKGQPQPQDGEVIEIKLFDSQSAPKTLTYKDEKVTLEKAIKFLNEN